MGFSAASLLQSYQFSLYIFIVCNGLSCKNGSGVAMDKCKNAAIKPLQDKKKSSRPEIDGFRVHLRSMC